MPAPLWRHGHDLVHLLDRQPGTAGAAVAGLTTVLPSRGRRFRPRRGLGRVRRRGPGGSGRVLAKPSFQLAAALLQGGILRARYGVLQPQRRQLVQQRRRIRSRYRRL